MNRAEIILSAATGRSITCLELEYKNEVQVIRPSEALEAMREIAWEAYKFKGELEHSRPTDRFNEWFEREITEV